MRPDTTRRVRTLTRRQHVPVTPEEAFAFFADALNLEAITPPWLRFRMITPGPIRMGPGTRIEYRLRLHRVPIRWVSEITVWEAGRRFVDVQVEGPYRLWEHTHTFDPDDGGTLIGDRVRYSLPHGPLGAVAHRAFVRRDLARIFEFRRRAVAWRLGA